MNSYLFVKNSLKSEPKTWLITGVAGFIGSNLLEILLQLNQRVVGLDNFSTGYQSNLDEVKDSLSHEQWARFKFLHGDIRDLQSCRNVCNGIDYVLHQAALGSVPRSIDDPIATNQSNVDGFLNMLVAAKDAKVKSFTYAASSSTYGDHPDLPKLESKIGNPLSPYAVSKYVNELYADVFAKCYEFKTIGLRYFNVFGPRQNPNGAYAAVIPKWISSMLREEPIAINGDGESSRDFTYVKNAVQANLLAATEIQTSALSQVYNVAIGESTSLNQLYSYLRERIEMRLPSLKVAKPIYQGFRPGDVKRSLADINKAKSLLGYQPSHKIADGLDEALDWYLKCFSKNQA